MEKMAGEGDAAVAPRSRRRRGLAAVEAVEQAMELRVGGEGILGLGVGELAGIGEGGCRRRGEPRGSWSAVLRWRWWSAVAAAIRRRKSSGRLKKEEGVCGGPAHQDTLHLHRCAAPPSRPTRLEARRTGAPSPRA
jgi:hypothetical protein